jgi:chemotaxis protein CheD
MYEIFAGDFYATTKKDVILTTLLGSCISVCIRDKLSGVVGMNHFMLPGTIKTDEILYSEDARYGINAMELLINNMMKLGAKRDNLEAKVFGGGKILGTSLNNVAKTNIEFVRLYLQIEEIPIIASNVGGNYGRKIFLFSDTFVVYLKRIEYNKTLDEAVAREKEFFKWMKLQREKEGDLTLFSDRKDMGNGKTN